MRASLLRSCALLVLSGCGATPPQVASAPAPAPSTPAPVLAAAPPPGALDPEWSVAECPSGRASYVTDDAGTSYFLNGRGRAARDDRGVTRATDLASGALVHAVRVGDHWIFGTFDGALYRAATFLGDLTPLGWVPGGDADRIVQGETLVLRTWAGPFLYVDDARGLVPVPVPEGRVAASALVMPPSTFVLLLEPGEVVVSRDGGARWSTLHPADAIVGLALDAGQPVLLTAAGLRLALGADDALHTLAAPDRPGPSDESEEIDVAAVEGALVDAALVQAMESDEASWVDDPFCVDDDLPLSVTTAWGDGPPPRQIDDLEIPSFCDRVRAHAFVVVTCEPRRYDTAPGREVRVLDPSDGSLRTFAGLPRGVGGEQFQVIDSNGSRTFVLATGPVGATRFTLVDGARATAVSFGEMHPTSVHDDLALVVPPDAPDDAVPELVALPSGEPVDLALPADAGALSMLDFGIDGTLFAVTHEGEAFLAWLGAPGAWTALPYPEGTRYLQIVDAQHVVVGTNAGLRFTSDGGAHWSDEVRGWGTVRCGPGGCTLPDARVWRSPSLGRRVRVVTPEGAASEAHWPAPTTRRWLCTAPTAPPTHAEHPPPHVPRHRVDAGFGSVTFTPDSAPGSRMAWTGLDARGVFHASGVLPASDGRWAEVVSTTRNYALVFDGAHVAIVQARRSELLALHMIENRWIHGGALPDGRSVLIGAYAPSPEQSEAFHVVVVDASGRVAAERDVVLHRALGRDVAYASGPDGAAGIAFRVMPDADHWTVLPIDGSPAVVLDARLENNTPCTGPRPWTLVIEDDTSVQHAVALELDHGRSYRHTFAWIGAGGAGACLRALAHVPEDEGHDVVVAWSSGRRPSGRLLDDSATGQALFCTAPADEAAPTAPASPPETSSALEISPDMMRQIQAQLLGERGGE